MFGNYADIIPYDLVNKESLDLWLLEMIIVVWIGGVRVCFVKGHCDTWIYQFRTKAADFCNTNTATESVP